MRLYTIQLIATLALAILVAPLAAAAQQATRTIPIVMAGIGDPVGEGCIASLARSGEPSRA